MRSIFVLLLVLTTCAQAATSVVDDNGRRFDLPSAPWKLVSLAPHVTDMLIGLGAKSRIVGVVDDHESRGAHTVSLSGLPVVADAFAVSEERLLAQHPDVVIVWAEGTPTARIARLERLGFRVFVLKTRQLDDLARQLEVLGVLAGQPVAGRQQAAVFRQRLQALNQQYQHGPRLTYFYQVWRQPLYSLHGGHLLSQALARCGADNILPPGPVAAPLVAQEFVVQANPHVIFFGKEDAGASHQLWSKFPSLRAVKDRRLIALDDPRLARPGPVLLDAVEPLCRQLQPWRVRAKQN
jgi:iron complex transport system substrate-binding protein